MLVGIVHWLPVPVCDVELTMDCVQSFGRGRWLWASPMELNMAELTTHIDPIHKNHVLPSTFSHLNVSP